LEIDASPDAVSAEERLACSQPVLIFPPVLTVPDMNTCQEARIVAGLSYSNAVPAEMSFLETRIKREQ
jgi:hypothetical protein